MAEYIDCRNCSAPECEGCNIYTLAEMLYKGKLDSLMDDHCSITPAADVVPVVRCDNCRHMKLLDGVVRFCTIWNAPNGLGAEGYCSYGERRTE